MRNRSYANVNNCGHYNAVDARLDLADLRPELRHAPAHLRMREVAALVRAVRLGDGDRRLPLRHRLRKPA